MRKMIQNNLLKNSIAAYFAAVEIHNKPRIDYRYETVTLLLVNAWELALKAYINKNIKTKKIYTKEGKTINLKTALIYVNDYINVSTPNKFLAIKENVEAIEYYRNSITHFYSEKIEPLIFMLVAKASLNYYTFIKNYFSKDILTDEGLIILPIGFKLPFRPEDFLSSKASEYSSSNEAKYFINDIVKITKRLNELGIEESIVLGFDVFFDSIRNIKNSDLLVAITNVEDADCTISRTTKINISNEKGVQVVKLDEQSLQETYPYSHAMLTEWCKKYIKGFKQGDYYNSIKAQIKEDPKCVYIRRLDINNSRSSAKTYYSDHALNKVKELYEKQKDI